MIRGIAIMGLNGCRKLLFSRTKVFSSSYFGTKSIEQNVGIILKELEKWNVAC